MKLAYCKILSQHNGAVQEDRCEIVIQSPGGTYPRKVRVGSLGAKQMKLYLHNCTKKGVYSIFFHETPKTGVYPGEATHTPFQWECPPRDPIPKLLNCCDRIVQY